jgi:hypothetical protein
MLGQTPARPSFAVKPDGFIEFLGSDATLPDFNTKSS